MIRKFVMFLSLTLAVLSSVSTAWADEYVNGYYRQDGTYVQPYVRSSPDNSYNNNWSVRGNTNPYTDQQGTKAPTFNDRTPGYNTKTYGDPGYIDNGYRTGGPYR